MNLILLILFIALIASLWLYPIATPVLGIVFLLFSLAMAISAIFKKHKQSENPRAKIAKDVLVLVITLLLIIFLGGLAGMFANQYTSPHFGVIVGFVSAILTSFAVGYAVRWGVGKLGRRSDSNITT
jgi:amino acid transporter